jgi:hypothetical protein
VPFYACADRFGKCVLTINDGAFKPRPSTRKRPGKPLFQSKAGDIVGQQLRFDLGHFSLRVAAITTASETGKGVEARAWLPARGGKTACATPAAQPEECAVKHLLLAGVLLGMAASCTAARAQTLQEQLAAYRAIYPHWQRAYDQCHPSPTRRLPENSPACKSTDYYGKQLNSFGFCRDLQGWIDAEPLHDGGVIDFDNVWYRCRRASEP